MCSGELRVFGNVGLAWDYRLALILETDNPILGFVVVRRSRLAVEDVVLERSILVEVAAAAERYNLSRLALSPDVKLGGRAYFFCAIPPARNMWVKSGRVRRRSILEDAVKDGVAKNGQATALRLLGAEAP